jgi:hypothetical protein
VCVIDICFDTVYEVVSALMLDFNLFPNSFDVLHSMCVNLWVVSVVQNAGTVVDAKEAQLVDLYYNKFWGLKFATAASCTVLRVDQVTLHLQTFWPGNGYRYYLLQCNNY